MIDEIYLADFSGNPEEPMFLWEDDSAYYYKQVKSFDGILSNPQSASKSQYATLEEFAAKHDAENLRERELPANHYHRRMRRPTDDIPRCEDDTQALADALLALEQLNARLRGVLQTVHPVKAHLEVYGHSIRDLHVLACMEFEAGCTGVLRANGYTGARWTTANYVNLIDPLLLQHYSAVLLLAPALDEFRPFDGWSSSAATQTLPWYQDYHSTKHDREREFRKASLGNALRAVAAATILCDGQFGWQPELKAFRLRREGDVPAELLHVPNGDLARLKWKATPYFK